MSIGSGTQASITTRIGSLGSNLVFARSGGAPAQGNVRQAQGSSASLTYEDALALSAPGAVLGAVAVAPEVSTRQQVVAGNLNVNTAIRGVDETYLEVRNYEIAEGEFFTPTQLSTRALVVVLGSNVAATLFPEGDPVGRNVRINRLQFRVVGTLVSKGGSGFGNEDDVAMVPITTSLTRLSQQRTNQGQRSVSVINIKAESDKAVPLVKESAAAILRERHRIQGEDDFTLTSQEDTLATLTQVTGVMTAFLGSIAGISLLVGGIGIMNIMLVSVTERTREIGIRKAVGAKRRDILAQFLVEATMMSLVGGGVGLAMGVVISRLVNGVQLNNQPLQTVVSPDIALLAVTVSAAVGLFFGIYPALQASKLNPIQALRYE
jgi:putative ABC transport system permease protein